MTDENEVAKVYIQKFYIDCNLTGRRLRKKPTDAKWRYKQQNMKKNNKGFGLTLVLNALKSCSYSTITASASIFFNINHWNSLPSNRKSNNLQNWFVFSTVAPSIRKIYVFLQNNLLKNLNHHEVFKDQLEQYNKN